MLCRTAALCTLCPPYPALQSNICSSVSFKCPYVARMRVVLVGIKSAKACFVPWMNGEERKDVDKVKNGRKRTAKTIHVSSVLRMLGCCRCCCSTHTGCTMDFYTRENITFTVYAMHILHECVAHENDQPDAIKMKREKKESLQCRDIRCWIISSMRCCCCTRPASGVQIMRTATI